MAPKKVSEPMEWFEWINEFTGILLLDSSPTEPVIPVLLKNEAWIRFSFDDGMTPQQAFQKLLLDY